MRQNKNLEDLKARIGELSPEEREELALWLLPSPSSGAPYKLHREELLKAENWFWQRIATARNPREKNARRRIWLIFILMRYGGLRLPEIFALRGANINFEEGTVMAGAGHEGRETPLPRSIARKMRSVWLEWPEAHLQPLPFRCDSGQVRRSLLNCAQACGLPPGLLNARSMRRNRGREIERAGANAGLADLFLGRARENACFDQKMAGALLRNLIQKDYGPQTSARNVFRGEIISLEQTGILAHLTLRTREGLKVAAIITDASRARLNLEVGSEASAIVKAPWVEVRPKYAEEEDQPNTFYGVVQKIREDGEAREISVTLPQGPVMASLIIKKDLPGPMSETFPAQNRADLQPGMEAFVSFSVLAVIITSS